MINKVVGPPVSGAMQRPDGVLPVIPRRPAFGGKPEGMPLWYVLPSPAESKIQWFTEHLLSAFHLGGGCVGG